MSSIYLGHFILRNAPRTPHRSLVKEMFGKRCMSAKSNGRFNTIIIVQCALSCYIWARYTLYSEHRVPLNTVCSRSFHIFGLGKYIIDHLLKSVYFVYVYKNVSCFSVTHNLWSIERLDTWWRHQMETTSACLAFCVGNSPVTGDFSTQKPVTWSFDVFLDLRLNQQLRKLL